MTIEDQWSKRRDSLGFLNTAWFWEHADVLDEHLSNIKHIYHLSDTNYIQEWRAIDMWTLHPNVVMFQGVWKFTDPTIADLQTVCLSVIGKSPSLLPYMVFPTMEDLESEWWAHPVRRQWSPLKWWFANREDEARLFTKLCATHLQAADWHLAGMSWANIEYSVLCNVLKLSTPIPTMLRDQALVQQPMF